MRLEIVVTRPQQYKPQISLAFSLRAIFFAMALMLAPSLVADEPVKVVIWAEGNMAYATVDGERQDPFDISTFIENQQPYKHTCLQATNLTIEDSFPLAVEIHGSAEADILVYKGSRSAVIQGGEGADKITGGTGNDTIYGEAGEDVIEGGEGDDTIYGGDDKDTISGGLGDDTIDAGKGNDSVKGGRGIDRICGGEDADELWGDEGADLILGAEGSDTLHGGSGSDTLIAESIEKWKEHNAVSAQAVAVPNFSFTDGDAYKRAPTESGDAKPVISDRLLGGDDADVLVGGTGNDFLSGESGADFLFGAQGNDELYGGAFVDRLWGGSGDDKIFGGSESDEIVGGEGNDLICAGDSPEDKDHTNHWIVADGWGKDSDPGTGDGNDRLFALGKGKVWIWAGNGQNTIVTGEGDSEVRSGSAMDDVRDEGGRNRFFLGDGNNVVALTGADDLLVCGVGNDTVSKKTGGKTTLVLREGANVAELGIDTALTGDVLVLAGVKAGANHNEDYSTWDLEKNSTDKQQIKVNAEPEKTAVIATGDGDDEIAIQGSHAVVFAHDGRDVISTGIGKDRIVAGAGDDTVNVGEGDDVVIAGDGEDTLEGGKGNDFICGDELPLTIAGSEVAASTTRFTWFDKDFLDPNQRVFPSLPVRFLALVEDREYFTDPLKCVPICLAQGSYAGNATGGKDKIDGGDGNDWLLGGNGPDAIHGGPETDYIDGGAGQDVLFGDTLQRDVGADDVVLGGDNDDAIYGGKGLDQVYGGEGNDVLFGDSTVSTTEVGERSIDLEFGSPVTLRRVRVSQRLWGEAGEDTLHAWAADDAADNTAQSWGDELYGGAGADYLYGNLGKDLLIGGDLATISGDAPDYLHGDYHNGSSYVRSDGSTPGKGADDILFGDLGSDQLYGGGGADFLFGGEDNDWLEGMDGNDSLYGGSGPDLLVMDVDHRYQRNANDRFDGHGSNRPGDAKKDDAVDILVVMGDRNNYTNQDKADWITIKPNGNLSDLAVFYLNSSPSPEAQPTFTVTWMHKGDDRSVPLVEQFQIQGLSGNDTITVDLPDEIISQLSASSGAFRAADGSIRFDTLSMARPWLTTITGGPGNDVINGTNGRDYVDGGDGCDTIYGRGGDDRLRGGAGNDKDFDRLYAGPGNDDLFGGSGQNLLSAWPDFPLLNDVQGPCVPGQLEKDKFLNGQKTIDTGVNRMLGNSKTDWLFGGTGIDLLYGNGGSDKLYGKDGTEFQDKEGDSKQAEQWIAYARSTNRCWYVGGSDGVDNIDVNYVTNPRNALFGRHIASMKARGNFEPLISGVDGLLAYALDGTPVHDGSSFVYQAANIASESSQDGRAQMKMALYTKLQDTPLQDIQRDKERGVPLDDVLAMIIDAGGGDDVIQIGETVQDSVWIAAGAGNDTVVIEPQRAFLPDRTDHINAITGSVKMRNRNDDWKSSQTEVRDWAGLRIFDNKPFPLHSLLEGNDKFVRSCVIGNLTIDSARSQSPDYDWYEINLCWTKVGSGDYLTIMADPEAPISFEAYYNEGPNPASNAANPSMVFDGGEFKASPPASAKRYVSQPLGIDLQDSESSRLPLSTLNASFTDSIQDKPFLLKVFQAQGIPTTYQIEIRLASTPDSTEKRTEPTDLGMLSGTTTLTGLTLHNAGDTDSFKFKVAKGIEKPKIEIVCDDKNIDNEPTIEWADGSCAFVVKRNPVGPLEPCHYSVSIRLDSAVDGCLDLDGNTTIPIDVEDLRSASLVIEAIDTSVDATAGGEYFLKIAGQPQEYPLLLPRTEIPLLSSGLAKRHEIHAPRPPSKSQEVLYGKKLEIVWGKDQTTTIVLADKGRPKFDDHSTKNINHFSQSDSGRMLEELVDWLNKSIPSQDPPSSHNLKFAAEGGRLVISANQEFHLEKSDLADLLGLDTSADKPVSQPAYQPLKNLELSFYSKAKTGETSAPTLPPLTWRLVTDRSQSTRIDYGFPDPPSKTQPGTDSSVTYGQTVDARDYALFPLAERRDVIFGGDGNDRLLGGSGEDWIFGGEGNDVLSGGMDLQASDVVFGGAGDDFFQIQTDRWPILPSTRREGDPALADEFDGGEGYDRILYLGGDQVPRQADLPRHYIRDFVMIGYDRFLARYRFATVPWEIPHDGTGKSTPRFIRRNDSVPMVFYAYFQAKGIEGTLVDTRGGEDIIHADSGFYFPPSGQSWGVAPGDVQAGAQAYERMEFRGGDGADLIYGSSGSDVIYGEDDADIVIGGQGDDRILGGQDGDYLYGRVLDITAKVNELYKEIILESPEECQKSPSDAYVDLRYLFPTRLDHAWPSDSQIDSIICPDLKELATRTGSIDENVKDHYLWDHAFEIELPVGETVEGLLPAKLSDRSGFVVTTKQGDKRVKRFLQGPVTRYQLFRLQASDEFDENSPGADLKVSGLGWSYIMTAQTSLESAKIRADHQLPKLALEVTNNPSLTEGTSEPASILGFDGKMRKGWDRVEPILSDSTGTGESNTSKVSIKNAEGTELFTFEIQDHVIDEYFLLGDVDKDGFSDVALKVTPKSVAGRWAEFVVIMGRKSTQNNGVWTIPIRGGTSRPERCFQFCRPENFYQKEKPGISDLRAGDFDGNGIMDLLFVQESDSDPDTHEFFIGYDFGAIVGTTIKTSIGETTTRRSATPLSPDKAVEISPIESKLFYLRNKPDCIARQHEGISRLLHRKEPDSAEKTHQVPFPLDFDGDGFEEIAIVTKGDSPSLSQEKISIIFGAQSASTDVKPQLLTNLEIPGAASALVENATGEEFVTTGNLDSVQFFENNQLSVRAESNFGNQKVKLNYKPFKLGLTSDGEKTKAELSLPPRNGVIYFRHYNNNDEPISLTFEIAGLKRERKVGKKALEEYRLHLLNGEFMFYVRDMNNGAPWELWTAKESNETLEQENRTFSIKVEDGTQTPQIFSHFWAGGNENWYKMRFVGDGQIGDYLALSVTEDSQGSDGAISRISDKLHEFKPEFSGAKVASSIDGVFDLAKLRELRPDIIDSAKLIITFDNAAEQDLNYSLVDVWLVGETEDEAYVKFKKALALEGRSEGARSTLNLGSDCPELTGKLKELFYDRGFNRIRLIVKPSVKKVGTQRPYCWTSADQPSLTIKTKPSSGVVADLYTADGRFVRGGRQVLDLRHVKAGEYLLRVSDPLSDFDHPLFSSGFVREEPISYRIEIEAPKLGDFHPISDNDEIFGENGDDVVVGNHGFDRLLGGYGLDKIIGEADEVKDAGSYFSSRDEQPSGEPEGEKLADTSSELMSNTSLADRDPIIQDTEKKIEDPHLLKAIAKELGLYVGDESSGGLQLSRPIRSSDMAEIVHLRIEGGTDGKVTSLAGLEHALNLRSLDLTDHEVKKLEKLGPKSEGIFVYGARKLRSLRLDGNSGVSDLAPLAQMSDLRDLSLDGTKVSVLNHLSGLSRLTRLSIHGPDPSVQPATPGVSPTLITDLVPLKALKSLRTLNLANQGISDIHPLESLVNLAHLNLRNNKINEIESLADLRIADDDPPGFKSVDNYSAYREFNPNNQSDFTSANSPWQSNLYPVTGKIGNDYRYVGPGSTGAAAEWTFKYLPEGTYEVWASWTPNGNRATKVPYTINGVSIEGNIDQSSSLGQPGFGGACWKMIGTVPASGELKVQVSNKDVNGIVEADSIRLVRKEKLSSDQSHNSLLDDLRVVDLRGNPLNWHAIMPEEEVGIVEVITGAKGEGFQLVSDSMNGRLPPQLPLIPPQSLIPQSLVPSTSLTLDLSVPIDGKLKTDFGQADDAWNIATQSDGKFVVVGSSYTDRNGPIQLVIARYMPNGMLDYSFGKNGAVVISGSMVQHHGASVAVQTDGKLIVGSSKYLLRLHQNGAMDTTFGGNGFFETEIIIKGVAIQETNGDLNYIAVGSTIPSATDNSTKVAITRVTGEGKTSEGFGNKGVKILTFDKHGETACDVAIQSDRKIVVVGAASANGNNGHPRTGFVVRLNGDTGQEDSTFGNNGRVLNPNTLDAVLGVEICPNNSILVAGEKKDDGVKICRFDSIGNVDSSFTTTQPGGNFSATEVAILQGSCYVFGSLAGDDSNPERFAVFKYSDDGTLDTTFGGNGIAVTDFIGDLSGQAYGQDGAVLPNGTVVTVGYRRYEGSAADPKKHDFFIAMHDSAGNPISTPFAFEATTNSDQISAGIKDGKLTIDSKPTFVGTAKVKLIAKDTSPGNEGLQSEVVFDVTSMPSTQDVLAESSTSGRMFSDVAVLPEGKYVVAWSDPNNGNAIIKAQIFDKSGKALREAFDVASGQGNSQIVNVASNALGQFVIQWECPSSSGFVRAVRYGSEFSPIDQEAQEFTNSASIAGDSSVVMLRNGDVLAAWESGNRTKIEMRTLQISDSKMSEIVQVAQENMVLGPQLASDNDGNWSVLWQARNSGSKVFARRFENASGALSEQFELSTEDRLVGPPKAFAMTTDSGLVVPTFDAGLTAVFLQNFDKDFKERRPKIQVETEGVVSNPTITMLAGGGYVLGWHRVADVNDHKKVTDFVARRYAADGQPLTPVVNLSGKFERLEGYSRLIADDDSIVATWTAYNESPSRDKPIQAFVKRIQYNIGGVIHGSAYVDENKNGFKNDDEEGIEGWKVFLDSDADNVCDAGERTTITDSNGDYCFTGLQFGDHRIVVDTNVPWKPVNAFQKVKLSHQSPIGKASFPSSR